MQEKVPMAQQLKQLQNDIESKTKEAQRLKLYLENRQLSDLQEQENKLNQQLKLIQADDTNDDELMKLNLKIYQLKKQKQKRDIEENTYKMKIWNLQKTNELEKIVIHKMELEKLQQNTSMIDQMIFKKQSELEGIEEEQQKRDTSSLSILDKALATAKALEEELNSGVLDARKKALLADSLLKDDDESIGMREQIFAELKGKLNREKKELQYQTDMKLKMLNEQRLKILEDEEKLLMKKAVNRAIMERGEEFLSEVELGNAPPMNLLAKNLGVTPESYLAQQSFEPVENILKKYGKNYEMSAQQRILQYQKELRETEKQYNKTYGEEIVLPPLNVDPELKLMTMDIINDIIEESFELAKKNEFNFMDLKKKKGYLLSKTEQQSKIIHFHHTNIIIKEINEELIENTADAFLREICDEVLNLNEFCLLLGGELIARAIFSTRKLKTKEEQMKDIILDMEFKNQALKKDNQKIMHHTLITEEERKQIDTITKNKTRDNQISAILKSKKELFDVEAIVLDPDKECITEIESNKLKEKERNYWACYPQYSETVGGTKGIKGGNLTAFTISLNGKIMAIALTGAWILVYNLEKKTRLIRVRKEAGKIVVSLELSYNSTSLLVLFNDNTAKLYSFNSKSNKMAIASGYCSKDEMKATDLLEVTTIERAYLLTAQDKFIKGLEELNFTVSCFHGSFNLFGIQNSFMVGTKNGTILKWNHNSKLEFDSQKKKAAKKDLTFDRISNFTTIHGEIPTQKEIPFPPDSAPYKLSTVQPSHSQSEHIFREFHYEHKYEIVFLGMIEYENNLISLDKAGHIYIWKYAQETFKPSLSYHPIYKNRITLTVPKYVFAGNKKHQFPKTKEGNEGVIRPTSISPEQRQAIKTYEDNNHIKDSKAFVEEKLRDNCIRALTLPKKLPNYNNPVWINEYIFLQNNEDKLLLRHCSLFFQTFKDDCTILNAALCKKKENLFIQLLRPYPIKENNKAIDTIYQPLEKKDVRKFIIEFVCYKIKERTLTKIKITYETSLKSKSEEILTKNSFPFAISHPTPPFGLPYLYVLKQDTITVFSPITGQKLHIISIKDQIKNNIRKTDLIFNNMLISHKYLFVSAKQGFDSLIKFEIKGNYETSELQNEKANFLKLWKNEKIQNNH